MNDFLNTFQSIFSSALRMSVPLILASLGGVYSARAGVVAMGLEGFMLLGAFTSAYVTYLTQNPLIGLLAGMVAGITISLLHGLFVIQFKINQIIGGIGVNLFALGLTTLLMQIVWGNRGKSPTIPTIKGITLPILGKSSPLFFLAILLCLCSYYILYKMKFGLHLRMVGENPLAAASLGIKVHRTKYLALMITGAFSGLGGAYLSIDQLDLFARNMTAGRGFIALSIDILGRYHPLGILGGSFLFGLADSLQISLQRYNIPGQLLQMLPYVATLLVVVFGVRYVKAPASMGNNSDES